MVEIKKSIFNIIFTCFIFCLSAYALLHIFSNSYAIDISPSPPSNSFSTNNTNSTKTNLISKALNNSGTYSQYYHNFETIANFKIKGNSHILYNIMKNLEYPTTSVLLELTNDNPISITDNGILYILSHGYNQTNLQNNIFSTNEYGPVTDDFAKEYITQIALWLYLYEHKDKFATNYCILASQNHNSCDFYKTDNTLMSSTEIRKVISDASNNDNYKFLNYITLLVDKANNYKGYSQPTIGNIPEKITNYNISDEDKSLITEMISPIPSSNNDNYMYYSVEIIDPNGYGVYLLNENNEKITNLSNLSGPFKLYVPLEEEIDNINLASIGVNITASFSNPSGYTYRVTSPKSALLNKEKKQVFSDVLLGYIPIETIETTLFLENVVKVSKIDGDSQENLAGATLEITNKLDNSIVATIISSTEPKYIPLKTGEYKICETQAPDGYSLNTGCLDFSIDDTKNTSVTIKNYKLIVNIPNTSSNMPKFFYTTGTILLLIGLFLLLAPIVLKRKKFKVSDT